MSPEVISFSNTDDMFAHIREGVERAKARILPSQEKITYGDYWMQAYEEFLIFGRIHTTKELIEAEEKLGATPEEIEWEQNVMKASYEDGFRFGRAYSVVEPDGELGDTHVSVMIPITKENFERAKELRWDTFEIILEDWYIEAVERLRSEYYQINGR